ncbi:sensor histidine kinase [Flindersiella endophytica]
MNALLRSVWAEPRPPSPRPRWWLDWVLVGALVPTAVFEGVVRTDVSYRVATIVIAVGLIPTLLWRRSHPLLVVAIAFGVCGLSPLLMNGTQPDLNTFAFMLLLPYALYRWGSGREIVIGSVIVLAKLGFTLALDQLGPMETFGGVGVLTAAAAAGAALRYRASARQRQFEKVKLLERERLARDLHDTVAHHVSAMAIRAQAGIATAQLEPGAAVDALRLIEAEASKALAEMRGMVRLLRKNEPADRAPSPGVRELELLASPSGDPHVGVDLAGDLDDLPPPVVTVLYRLAQEAVTNARRHARHVTRIDVSVAADDRSVRLRVTDDGEATTTRSQGSPGFGLIGMTERAGLLGGTCEAGPDPDRARGWTVSAVLPRTGTGLAAG